MDAIILEAMRSSGIPYIKDIPWGTHICGFYVADNDLIEMSLQYLKAGLKNNEYCIWVVSESIKTLDAVKALTSAEIYIENQIEVLSHKEWYLKYGDFQYEGVLEAWRGKVDFALSKGFDGLRICGSTTWLAERYWKAFLEYEEIVNKRITSWKMIALCPYQLGECSIYHVLDIVRNHQFSFIHGSGDLRNIGSITSFNRFNLVGKMAASIAHEIRNPLTAVKGFLQLLQNQDDLKPYQRYFTIMIGELDRSNQIITDYLSLAKDKPAGFKKENLNSVLDSLQPLIQAKAVGEDKNFVLKTNPVGDFLADSNDIRRVILNLSHNSLDAMDIGGTLEIETYMEDDRIVLKIADTGTGIPKEILDKIGTPFVTTKGNGNGLGLFVCCNILKNHKAAMEIKSSSAGTNVYIYFPLFEEGVWSVSAG